MAHIKAANHKVFYTLDELREDESDLLSKYPVRTFPGNPRGTGEFGLRALTNAARALYLGELASAKRFNAIALECVAAGARSMAAGLGVDVDYEVDGKRYRGSADQGSSLAQPTKYLRALTIAVCLRAPSAIRELLAVPLEVIEKAAGTMDAAYLRYVAAWRALLQRASETPALLDEAASLFDPSALRAADPKSAARHSTNIPIARALLNNDAAKIDAGLASALKAHKSWWGRGTQLNDPEGLIANQPAALASLALQRGLEVTATSDYMPRWLIEGRDPE
jgi:hypothetical protein